MNPAQLQPPNGPDPVSTRIEGTLKAMLLRGLYAARKIAVNSAELRHEHGQTRPLRTA